MTKTALLAASAVLALSAGGASAASHPAATSAHSGKFAHAYLLHSPKGLKTLYDQNDDSQGYADVSDNFDSGSFDSYDDQGADDFTVPSGSTWTVKEVDVSGLYFNGYGPSDGQTVSFYKDKKGKPGKQVATMQTNGADDGFGNFAISLGKKGVKLKSGTYWVSVQANMNFSSGAGEWGWATRNTQNGNAAMWQNPGDGFATGCTKWSPEAACLGGVAGPDHMFALKGKSKG